MLPPHKMMKIASKLFAQLALGILLAGCSKSENDSDVIYTKESGEKTKDITSLEGKVSYEVLGGGSIPPGAKRLHEQARKKGQAGDYNEAIALLNKAIALAPDWAYPRYDLAYTYLLKAEHVKAIQEYQRVDELEPRGFFTTKTALWTLQREQSGQFPTGTYSAYLSLEWMPESEKSNAVEKMVVKWPSLTPVWKERANLTKNTDQRREYLDIALKMDADAETHGILEINRAALFDSEGQMQQARALLENIITNTNSTLGTVALAKQMKKLFNK
jgi:tetratricopeptide (TPR) repeat protein